MHPTPLSLEPGVSAWALPTDSTIAGAARARISQELRTFELPDDAVDSAVLMVSELATNAHEHARSERAPSSEPTELWLYPRTTGTGHIDLVIAVFDRLPGRLPRLRTVDVLAEHGRGLALIDNLTGERWGCGPTHSRLYGTTVRGKAIWFALPVPAGVPHLHLLARELTPYRAVLITRVMHPIGRPPHLHVAAVRDGATPTEQITHASRNNSPADFRWTCGEPVKGHELSDKALTIVHALTGRP